MPHVSKKELDKKTFEKLFTKLVKILQKAQSKNKFSYVLDELLTDTEKIMLAKRLAIILLLFAKFPQHRISDTLFVSPSTVARMSLNVEIGKYDAIKNISEQEKTDLERIIWLLLTAGGIMPPRVGGRYWRKKGYKALLGN